MLLHEYFGLLLTGNTSLQKMLLIVGPPRSGKGTLNRLLIKVLGEKDVCAPQTSTFAERFGLQSLIGKSLTAVSDARFSGKDAQKAVEKMLNITGEDPVTIDQKHREAVTTRLGTRILILSNEIPRLPDAAGALVGRVLAIQLQNSFLGKEDTHLDEKLCTELPGIVKYWVCGLQRLMKRGHFIQPKSGREIINDMRNLGNPINEFLKECCEFGAGYFCPTGQLYTAWEMWCKRKGPMLAVIVYLEEISVLDFQIKFKSAEGQTMLTTIKVFN